MPGINQLGGALTAVPTTTPDMADTDNKANNAQALAGLQVAANDGVKAVTVAKDIDTNRNQQERRSFAGLARGGRRDAKTGDRVNLGSGRATTEKAATRDQQRLIRRLNDLFAPGPRVKAQAEQMKAKDARAQSIAEAAAEVRERVADAIQQQQSNSSDTPA